MVVERCAPEVLRVFESYGSKITVRSDFVEDMVSSRWDSEYRGATKFKKGKQRMYEAELAC